MRTLSIVLWAASATSLLAGFARSRFEPDFAIIWVGLGGAIAVFLGLGAVVCQTLS